MPDTPSSLQVALRDALQDVKAGRLPKQMVANALASAGQNDPEGFIKQLGAIFSLPDAPHRLDESHYRSIAMAARRLELDGLGRKIVEEGVAAKPEDDRLSEFLRRYLAESPSVAIAEEGQRMLEAELGLDKSGEQWTLTQAKLKDRLADFGALMDLYEKKGLAEDAKRVAAAAHIALPDSSYVLRNYGRALDQAGEWERGREQLEAALWAAGTSDAEASFLGAALSRHQDHEGALEAYLLATRRDPDDADNFIRSAIALLVALEQPDDGTKRARRLANDETISKMIEDALSCRFFDDVDAERIAPLMSRATRDGFALDPTLVADPSHKPNRIPFAERIRDAESWHDAVATELTKSNPEGESQTE